MASWERVGGKRGGRKRGRKDTGSGKNDGKLLSGVAMSVRIAMFLLTLGQFILSWTAPGFCALWRDLSWAWRRASVVFLVQSGIFPSQCCCWCKHFFIDRSSLLICDFVLGTINFAMRRKGFCHRAVLFLWHVFFHPSFLTE